MLSHIVYVLSETALCGDTHNSAKIEGLEIYAQHTGSSEGRELLTTIVIDENQKGFSRKELANLICVRIAIEIQNEITTGTETMVWTVVGYNLFIRAGEVGGGC
ncbi:hypothetical protein EVAR_54210_1 [Eumeta japonica]|uniref:Uncharacterized protein n=1 Tax=Eumeta variegata TaxID=151549 RepID=A0A4C1YC16_EUMVA|nr:hypothetical protein EVAR_54210_1 [Eumeta japonica]